MRRRCIVLVRKRIERGISVFLPLPVLRERVGVRVISIGAHRPLPNEPPPQPSPGVPEEGAKNEANMKLVLLVAGIGLALSAKTFAQRAGGPFPQPTDIAQFATVTTSYVSGHETLDGVNAGYRPRNSNDKSHGAYGNWPRTGTQWLELDWDKPISTNKTEIYWFDDNQGVRIPHAARLLMWDGNAFVPIPDASGPPPLVTNQFGIVAFKEITTTKLRLEMDGEGNNSTGVLAWRVDDSGKSPHFPPIVAPVTERDVVVGGKTHLTSSAKSISEQPTAMWSKDSGPGEVTFADAAKMTTDASFSAPGDYVLKLTVSDADASRSTPVTVHVIPVPPKEHLAAVWTSPYSIDSRFWLPRLKVQITTWIPHCFDKLNDPKLPEGGIQNFIEAANKLAGEPAAKHVGYPFSNAYVLNTLEAMCMAQMIDPAGDQQLARAQADLRGKIEEWIPRILAAQEPDGYLHTLTTISGRKRWSDNSLHEGYTAGYFIDAAIADFLMTGGKDRRMYDAAKKMADCWYENIGPAPKQPWYDGHETIEQTLIRFARLVDETDGKGHGDHYLALAKYLVDARGTLRDKTAYDQSQSPMTQQYTAEGHAVRAAYIYSALAALATQTDDINYQSAVHSIWANLVNRKYYVTGGIGSGDTSEGFGGDYHLGNNAYAESCADCGELFFQQNMLMGDPQSRYADLYEETLYNAVLGSVDLEGNNFTYTNPLDSSAKRYRWHVCPCCVGNIPRTMLDLPRWVYAADTNDLYVNLFIGGTMNAGKVAGQDVKITQATDYPWNGKVTLTVNPASAAKFALHIRVPNRQTSTLYIPSPKIEGIQSLAVNGAATTPNMVDGYAVLDREWKAGDKVEFELPLGVQRVTSDPHIKGNIGRVALRYGPLVYNLETADHQPMDTVLPDDAQLTAQFADNLLGGVMTITGKFADGSELKAIPNYARLNRGGRSIVWIRDK